MRLPCFPPPAIRFRLGCLASRHAIVVSPCRTLSADLPYWDDWEMVPVITGHEPVTLKWAWAQHNEHHMPVPKLILVGLFRWVASTSEPACISTRAWCPWRRP